jgi:hypothetical protein
MQKVEPLANYLQDKYGLALSDKSADKASGVLQGASAILKIAGGVAAAIGGGPGVVALLGALGTATGGAAAFAQRRKRKQSDAVAEAGIVALDAVPKGGAAIKNIVGDDPELAAEVEARYLKLKTAPKVN